MKILFPHEILHVLAGATRVLFSLADLCKTLGHSVTVLGHNSGGGISHFQPRQLRKYFPLRALSSRDLAFTDIYSKGAQQVRDADLVWSFSTMMSRVEDHLAGNPVPKRYWTYIHWPSAGDYPSLLTEKIWANSTYTAEATVARWGRPVQVLHPPIPLGRYKPSLGFDERIYDLCYIGRVEPQKLGSPPIMASFRDLRMVVVGADYGEAYPDYKLGSLTWVKNASFNEMRDILSQSKVYIHWRGLIHDPEHLGISCCEALASGIPIIVPKVGGPWTDISEYGKYCIGVDSVAEAKKELYRLVGDRAYWEEWSRKGLEGVKRFDYGVAKNKIRKALEGDK